MIGVADMVFRLASRGLLPHEHNLSIWEHADNSGWGVAVETFRTDSYVEAHGETLQGALEELMRATNRGADIGENP